MAQVKTFRGVEINVNGDGIFNARVNGEWLKADRLADMEKQIERERKRSKVTVAVPITQLGVKYYGARYGPGHWGAGEGVRHITLTGIRLDGHLQSKDEQTGEVIIGERFSRFGDGAVRRLTAKEVEEYLRLYKAERLARDAMHEFEERVKLTDDCETLVKQAIAEKIDDPREPVADEPDDPREHPAGKPSRHTPAMKGARP